MLYCLGNFFAFSKKEPGMQIVSELYKKRKTEWTDMTKVCVSFFDKMQEMANTNYET